MEYLRTVQIAFSAEDDLKAREVVHDMEIVIKQKNGLYPYTISEKFQEIKNGVPRKVKM